PSLLLSIFHPPPRSTLFPYTTLFRSAEEADLLSLSSDVSMAYFIQKGESIPLMSPEDALEVGLTEEDRFYISQSFPKFVGTPEMIKEQLAPFMKYADELVISCSVYDQKKRINSYRLLSETLLR